MRQPHHILRPNNSDKELIQFLYIALGSTSELETQIIISIELNFLDKEKANIVLNLTNEMIRMISSLIKSLKLGLKN
jgi:four helix bundle protein